MTRKSDVKLWISIKIMTIYANIVATGRYNIIFVLKSQKPFSTITIIRCIHIKEMIGCFEHFVRIYHFFFFMFPFLFEILFLTDYIFENNGIDRPLKPDWYPFFVLSLVPIDIFFFFSLSLSLYLILLFH